MKSRMPPIAMVYTTDDTAKRILPVDAPDRDSYAAQQ
jgi:hypothetical protein